MLRDDGFAAASVSYGAAALEMVKVHEPALILLDLRRPIMDGWSFVQQYRGASAAPAAIILMSASPDLPGIARQLGADGHLRKAVRPRRARCVRRDAHRRERTAGRGVIRGGAGNTGNAG